MIFGITLFELAVIAAVAAVVVSYGSPPEFSAVFRQLYIDLRSLARDDPANCFLLAATAMLFIWAVAIALRNTMGFS